MSMSTVAKMILESMDEEEQLLLSLLAKERRKRRWNVRPLNNGRHKYGEFNILVIQMKMVDGSTSNTSECLHNDSMTYFVGLNLSFTIKELILTQSPGIRYQSECSCYWRTCSESLPSNSSMLPVSAMYIEWCATSLNPGAPARSTSF